VGVLSGLLIIDGAVLLVIGFAMRTLRKMTSHYHRRLVGMTWNEIAQMRSRQNWLARGFYQRAPRARGGTTVMLIGTMLLGIGLLAYIAGD
jgi:hypothetical protein